MECRLQALQPEAAGALGNVSRLLLDIQEPLQTSVLMHARALCCTKSQDGDELLDLGTVKNRIRSIHRFLVAERIQRIKQIDGTTYENYYKHYPHSNQVKYESQTHLRAFLLPLFGEAAAIRMTPFVKIGQWGSSKTPWYSAQEVRQVNASLVRDEEKRGWVNSLAYGLLGAAVQRQLPLRAWEVQDDGGVSIHFKWDGEGRHTAMVAGITVIGAVHRKAQKPGHARTFLFQYQGTHMTGRRLKFELEQIGKKALLERPLNTQCLQYTGQAILLGLGVEPDAVAALSGLRPSKRLLRLRNKCIKAMRAGHFNPHEYLEHATGPGNVLCGGCGNDEHELIALACNHCGGDLERELTIEDQILAEFQQNVRLMLLATKQSVAGRIQETLREAGKL